MNKLDLNVFSCFLSVPSQEARHSETEERLPAKLHPLSGLYTHDAHCSPLL